MVQEWAGWGVDDGGFVAQKFIKSSGFRIAPSITKMALSKTDKELIDWVQRQINTGATSIAIPGFLVIGASNEVLEEVRRLCMLNGVSVEIKL